VLDRGRCVAPPSCCLGTPAVEHAVAAGAHKAGPDEEYDSKQDLPLHQLHNSGNDKDYRNHPQQSATHFRTLPTRSTNCATHRATTPNDHAANTPGVSSRLACIASTTASRRGQIKDLNATLRNNKLKLPSAEQGIRALAFASWGTGRPAAEPASTQSWPTIRCPRMVSRPLCR
jgi:hypothetical protein